MASSEHSRANPDSSQNRVGSPRRATFFHQLWTMLRRNILLKRRSLKMTIAEIVLPGLFVVMFGVLAGTREDRVWYHPESVTEFRALETRYPPTYNGLSLFTYPSRPYNVTTPDQTQYLVGYTPATPETEAIMRQAANFWNALAQPDPDGRYNASVLTPIAFATERAMEEAHLNITTVTIGVGVVFADERVSTLKYTLRYPATWMRLDALEKPYIEKYNTHSRCRQSRNSYYGGWYTTTPATTMVPDGAEDTEEYCPAINVLFSGFTGLQNVLAASYAKIKYKLPDTYSPIRLFTKLMPMGPEKESYMSAIGVHTIMPAFLLSNAFGFFIIFLIISLVNEKEKKYIASMEIMGLRPVIYWLSWIVIYMIVIFVVSLVALLIAKFANVYPRSDFFLLFILCMLFGASIIAMGFCVASLFKRPLTAGLITYVAIQLFGALGLLDALLPTMPDGGVWGLALLAPAAFFLALVRVSEAEQMGYGIGWGNAMDPVSIYPRTFCFGTAIIMLAVDFFLYLLLAAYLEKVFPSDDSPKERPWFCLLPSYLLRKSGSRSQVTQGHEQAGVDSPDIERVPEEMRSRVALSTHGLRKVFPGGKGDAVAVDGFTYEAYEDEILAILGHNGAGKTTLINMVTGMIMPTSGKAYVYGNDITHSEELDIARTMIGICPQHDVLFDTFTVREHIDFYARLKGFSASQAKEEFERIIDQIGMRTHSDVQAQKLSGGQKRRLSIAIAVVGNPKILILDEPTSGVDPYNRGHLWDMIRGLRKGRCVIITTQSMQEADVFADRKLIISHGKLRCAGTSLFLKNRFGLGYHLTMSVDRDFDESLLEEYVVSRVKGSYKTRAHAGEISFVLPKAEVAEFPELFHQLDGSMSKLGIRTYGVSLTTMEEIFLRLADEEADEKTGVFSQDGMGMIEVKKRRHDYTELAGTTFARPVKGAVSTWAKFLALAKIRVLLLLRTRIFLVFAVLIPLLLAVADGVINLMLGGGSSPYEMESLLSSDIPTMTTDEIKADFHSTRTNFVYDDQGGPDVSRLVDQLKTLGGQFDAINYFDLLDRTPHYAGYIFRSSLGANDSLDMATISYNGSSKLAVRYATDFLWGALLRLHNSEESISVTERPFPTRDIYSAMYGDMRFYRALPTSFLIAMALAIVPGIYGIDVCRDRQLKLRSQIRMTGCSMWLYWGSAFAVHMTQFTASFVMVLIVLAGFSIKAITDAILCVILLFLFHAPAMILFSYCASFLFAKRETATIGLPFPITVVATLSWVVVFMMDITTRDEGRTSTGLHYAFTFLMPLYGFFGGMMQIDKLAEVNSDRAARNETLLSPFAWDRHISVVFVAHAIHIPLLMFLIIFIESKHFNQNWLQYFGIVRKTAAKATGNHELKSEDDDIRQERILANDIDVKQDNTYAIVLRSLSKTFGKGTNATVLTTGSSRPKRVTLPPKPAVNNISMISPKGEVFGLLGPNGAGKSTTLSMITGEVTPSSGDIHVNGYNMQSETLSAIETMGSCPQTDTLWDDITMEEHLKLFAVLNNLPPQRSADSIKVFSEGLQITEHMRKKAAALSGGTKRKLTFVISMIGNPPLVLLDEPSTGMDPQSKRNLWDMIMQSFIGDRGAILTTHSMEEADALCDRIGIVVKGELQCIGSSQHLKDKFGSGYILEVKLSLQGNIDSVEHISAVAGIKAEIVAALPGAVCTEEFYNRLVFAVPKKWIKSLGTVFTTLDQVKQRLNFEEYSFSQTTIEQVFLHFARMQEAQESNGTPLEEVHLINPGYLNV